VDEPMLLLEMKAKPFYWVCNEVVSFPRESNIKRPYNTKHAYTFGKFKGHFHDNKVYTQKNKCSEHQLLFKNMFSLLESLVKVRYAELEIIAKILLPFSDGEIVKKFL
jgi:hypothetical protein